MVQPPEEPKQPALPLVPMVVAVLAAGAYVYLAYHSARDLPAWGLEGAALSTARLLAAGVFLAALGVGAWLARRQRVRSA